MTTVSKTSDLYIGCDYYGSNISNLVNSIAYKVTANVYGEVYLNNNQIIVMAKMDNGDIVGYVAVSDGTVMPHTAGHYYPNWHKGDARVTRAVPVTKLHILPANLVGRLMQRGIAHEHRAKVVNYLLAQG